jgi:hypothetical protein
LRPDDIQIEQDFISIALIKSFIQRLNAIVCFFLIYAKMVIIKKRKSGSSLCDISYMILKRRGDTNREGNSVTNAHVTRGP